MPPKQTTKTKKATRARKQAPMTRAHKQALARGRDDSRAVSRYLEALEAGKPRPGRPRTIQSVQTQLKAVETRVRGARGIDRLLALQQRADLRSALAQRRHVATQSATACLGLIDLAGARAGSGCRSPHNW